MKWKFPSWISTFWYCSTPFHRTLKAFNAASTFRVQSSVNIWHVYGSCQRLQVFHVLLDCGKLCQLRYQRWEVCFIRFYRVLIGISFFTNLGQPATKCCNSLVMWIAFTKAKPKEKQGVKCFGDTGALFYVIKHTRLLGFIDDRIRSAALLIFNSSTFGAGNLINVICVKENISIFNGLLKRH